MRITNPSAIMAAAVALATAPFASGLGINCNGCGFCSSLACPGGINSIKSYITEAIANGHGYDYFGTGIHVACTGYCCAFFQNGAQGTLTDVLSNVQQIINHGCHICGSNPTLPGNNVATGELTVNYVSNPCGGYCY